MPRQSAFLDESAPTFKTGAPRRLNLFGVKFAKGHRTQTQLSGTRPVFRAAKRPTR